MRNLILFYISALLLLASCHTTTVSPTRCSDPKKISDGDSVSIYVLPTAFTPNGDGRNDIYRLVGLHLHLDSSKLVIWDSLGLPVFNGSAKSGWDGTRTDGSKAAPGNYRVAARIVKENGTAIDVCSQVTILVYSENGCIVGNPNDYILEDQIDLYTGVAAYHSQDIFCH
ncbi:MAG: gliding motility-associated C-terminal domain-containing protein [Taibaiella sp.]|nr:gliding motility-associated C-terminal domain-containing protein [Taibaiella sp.]